MKTASAGFISHLGLDTTTIATCWKVKRTDDTILGFTDHDQDLDIDLSDGDGTITYKAATGYQRSAIDQKSDFRVAGLDIQGFLDSNALTEADLRAGRYDFADVKIFHVNWKDLSDGVLKLTTGQLGEVTHQEDLFTAELRNLLDRYHSQKIVELYTPDCLADLGDTRCKVQLDPPVWTPNTEAIAMPDRDAQSLGSGSPTQVNLVKPSSFLDRFFRCVQSGITGGSEPSWDTDLDASPGQTVDGTAVWEAIQAFTISASVLSATDNANFVSDYTGDAPDGFFDLGVLTWTSGNNNGLKQQVKAYTISPSLITLYLPMPFNIQAGDNFTMTAGCDKKLSTCRDKFDNIHNLRGFPHVPGNDEFFRIPDAAS